MFTGRLWELFLDSFPKILLPGLTATIPLTIISFSLAMVIAVVVTHEMRFAREVSGRTLFLDGGRIEEDKPSKELFNHPESPRLVSFLEKVL